MNTTIIGKTKPSKMELKIMFAFMRLSATVVTICMLIQWTMLAHCTNADKMDWTDDDDDDSGSGKFIFLSSHINLIQRPWLFLSICILFFDCRLPSFLLSIGQRIRIFFLLPRSILPCPSFCFIFWKSVSAMMNEYICYFFLLDSLPRDFAPILIQIPFIHVCRCVAFDYVKYSVLCFY